MPLPTKPIDCECPPAFVLDILDYLPGSVRMAACAKCGRTDLARPVITEDRPHDVEFHGYVIEGLSDDARIWASAWARFILVDDVRIYLPAAARYQTEDELRDAIANAGPLQKKARLRDLLMTLGMPASPPPSSLPIALAGFAGFWEGLQYTAETPVDELLDAATRFNGPRRLATEALAQYPDLRNLTLQMLWHPDESRRKGGRFLMETFHLEGDDTLEAIVCYLNLLEDNMTGEMYSIYDLLRKMGAAAAGALPALESAASRVEKRDYYMHQYLTKLIAQMSSKD